MNLSKARAVAKNPDQYTTEELDDALTAIVDSPDLTEAQVTRLQAAIDPVLRARIPDYMVTSSDGEVTSYHSKAQALELWQACIHRCIHEPTHCATLTEGDTITGFYARVDGVVLYDSRLVA